MLTRMRKALTYIWNRLQEQSSWSGFVYAIAGGYALPSPWNYMSVAFGMLKVFAPNNGLNGGS